MYFGEVVFFIFISISASSRQNQKILLDTLDQEVTKFSDCNALLDLNSLVRSHWIVFLLEHLFSASSTLRKYVLFLVYRGKGLPQQTGEHQERHDHDTREDNETEGTVCALLLVVHRGKVSVFSDGWFFTDCCFSQKRALKLQQLKQKELLEKEQQRERELERERQLIAKPAKRT